MSFLFYYYCKLLAPVYFAKPATPDSCVFWVWEKSAWLRSLLTKNAWVKEFLHYCSINCKSKCNLLALQEHVHQLTHKQVESKSFVQWYKTLLWFGQCFACIWFNIWFNLFVWKGSADAYREGKTLTYGLFEQSTIHCTNDLFPRPDRKKTNAPLQL